jgi:hypothetical protein
MLNYARSVGLCYYYWIGLTSWPLAFTYGKFGPRYNIIVMCNWAQSPTQKGWNFMWSASRGIGAASNLGAQLDSQLRFTTWSQHCNCYELKPPNHKSDKKILSPPPSSFSCQNTTSNFHFSYSKSLFFIVLFVVLLWIFYLLAQTQSTSWTWLIQLDAFIYSCSLNCPIPTWSNHSFSSWNCLIPTWWFIHPFTTRKCSPNQHIINNFLLVSTDLGKQLRNQEIYVTRINRVNIYLLVSTDLGKQLQNRSIMPLKSTEWTFICWFEQRNFNYSNFSFN